MEKKYLDEFLNSYKELKKFEDRYTEELYVAQAAGDEKAIHRYKLIVLEWNAKRAGVEIALDILGYHIEYQNRLPIIVPNSHA